MTMATTPKIESPLPYPSEAYIAGANSGNPKPAHDRRKVTAASADAACSVNASMTYVWMAWKLRIVPAPTKAMP